MSVNNTPHNRLVIGDSHFECTEDYATEYLEEKVQEVQGGLDALSQEHDKVRC